MPWTGDEFRFRHNRRLTPSQAEKAAEIANAMIGEGVDEGVAIATANRRVMRDREKKRTRPRYISTGKTVF